jgi:hypothetical protein
MIKWRRIMYEVPDWDYCNVPYGHSGKKKLADRTCIMCHGNLKSGFRCAAHGCKLSVVDGSDILKAELCKGGWKLL